MNRHPTIAPVPYSDGVDREMSRTDKVCAVMALPISILSCALGILFIAAVIWGMWSIVRPAFAAELTDGRPATSSELRALSNGFGPRATDWTKAPDPYAGNTSNHRGRAGGVFEDKGMGGIAGEVHCPDGRCQVAIQDMNDTKWGGVAKAKTAGEWQRFEPEKKASGNWRTLTWHADAGWNPFKIVWHVAGGARSQDGYGVEVCR